MSFSKTNKVRGKFESLETRQLFAADLAGGAVVDAPATADSAPVATASDRCEAPSVRLQLGVDIDAETLGWIVRQLVNSFRLINQCNWRSSLRFHNWRSLRFHIMTA